MEIRTDSSAYLNARQYWVDNHRHQNISQKPKTDTYYSTQHIYYQTVVKPFRRWLESQGCQIMVDRRNKFFGVDSYEVAVGIDYLKFELEHEYTMFLLKWS